MEARARDLQLAGMVQYVDGAGHGCVSRLGLLAIGAGDGPPPVSRGARDTSVPGPPGRLKHRKLRRRFTSSNRGPMPINWDKINADNSAKLLQPRDIFTALPHKPWSRLRPEQGEVLKQWFDRRDKPDLVIKQNTGGGKTLVGLLIGQSSINEGFGPVIYLVPDTYLIKQVVDEAPNGIAVTTDRHDERFLAGGAILVSTFEKLVNGRSSFGVRGQKPVTQLGTVIVDDAHSALAAARHQFCPTLPPDCPGFGELLDLFAEDLKRQSPKAFADLKDKDYSAALRVPPKATAERAAAALQILKKYGDNDDIKEFYFGWPLVADNLEMAIITFSHRGVEIKMPCPAIDMIPAFSQARRRVYLTATLADESILVTELGAAPDSIRDPITPERASDLGDRIILAPMSINPSLSEVTVQRIAREFADGDRDGDGTNTDKPINVVVLVPSGYRATAWEQFADVTVNVKTMGPVIDRLTAGEQVASWSSSTSTTASTYRTMPAGYLLSMAFPHRSQVLNNANPPHSPAQQPSRRAKCSEWNKAWAEASATSKTIAPSCCSPARQL